MENKLTLKKVKGNERRRKRLFFYICLVLLPSIQFAIFYVYVNLNSFILAFQKYVPNEGKLGFTIVSAGLENFKEAFNILIGKPYLLGNSALWFLCKVGVGITLALFFSFYIYKKGPLSGAFRVFLFMPQIISGVVFTLLFRYIVTDVYIKLMSDLGQTNVLGLLDNPATKKGTIIFYNLWMGFGINVLLFSGGMSAIDESIVESAQLDGVNFIQEFIFISVPMIWSTLSSFLVVAITGIFTDQMSLHALLGNFAGEMSTFGYFLYMNSSQADLVAKGTHLSYSVLSAIGLILTLIVLPITMIARKLFEKLGPREE